MSIKFTTKYLNNTKWDKKTKIIRDSQTTGLAIKIGVNAKTLEFYYKINGKLKRVTIGRFPSVSLIEARKQVADYRLILDKGLPLDYDDTSKMTFQQLYDEWSRVKSRTIKDSARHIDGIMTNHILPSLADYKLTDLTTAILLKPIEKRIQQGKNGVASIAFGRTKEMMNYGVIKGFLTANPLQTVTNKQLGLKKPVRDYVIPLDDLKLIYQCDIKSLVVPMLQFMALTFLRNNEIRLMKWKYINFKERKLSLPKEIMKNKKPFDVHLTDTVINILKSREELKEPHIDYVFFSNYENRPLTRTFVPVNYTHVRRATNTSDWKPHDMRRNVSHLVEQCDVDVVTADALLSHTLLSGSVAAIYQRSQLWDQRKDALIAWEKFLIKSGII